MVTDMIKYYYARINNASHVSEWKQCVFTSAQGWDHRLVMHDDGYTEKDAHTIVNSWNAVAKGYEYTLTIPSS